MLARSYGDRRTPVIASTSSLMAVFVRFQKMRKVLSPSWASMVKVTPLANWMSSPVALGGIRSMQSVIQNLYECPRHSSTLFPPGRRVSILVV